MLRAGQLFHASSIFGARLKNNGFGLYVLRDDTSVETVSNHNALGSGADLARLVLDMNSRIVTSRNMVLADLPAQLNTFIACVIINEVKNFDSQIGGDTRIATITKEADLIPIDS